MSIEFQFNSMQIDQQELLPALIAALKSNQSIRKSRKRRKRKSKETVRSLIQEIIDSIEE